MEVAEDAVVQLCAMFASTREPGRDRRVTITEHARRRGNI
jgi:hypothetical protein